MVGVSAPAMTATRSIWRIPPTGIPWLAEQSWSKLHASGEHVGLGSGKAGNSEAGHSNLGAGRCVMQDDVRLDAAVKDGSFKKNPIFLQAIEHAKKNGTALHLLAYLTYKSSHGCIDYPLAICEMARGCRTGSGILPHHL